VLSQFRRMANAHAKTGKYKAKHAMHLIRLLYSGIEALRSGQIRIDVGEHRAELLAVKSGALTFEQARDRALELDRAFQEAYRQTALPERPDYRRGGGGRVLGRGGGGECGPRGPGRTRGEGEGEGA